MSKLDNNVINNIKMLSLDMIKEAGSGNSYLSFNSASIFCALYMNHLKFAKDNSKWINRDRVLVSNEFLPAYYATLHIFGYDISIDSLKEYKKYNSITPGFASITNPFVEINSQMTGDVAASSVGIALGERYLENLIKIEKPKCNLIDFNTYCICTYSDIMNGLGYESLAYAGKERLNKLILIVIKDELLKDSSNDEAYIDDLDKFKLLGYNIIEIKGTNLSLVDEALDEAKESKKPSIILLNTYSKKNEFVFEYNKPLTNEDLNMLRGKYKIDIPFNIPEDIYTDINIHLDKRLNKLLNKWQVIKNNCLEDLKLKEVIDFLEKRELKIDFNVDKIQINDNYEEDLIIGNSKIFNIFAKKSPFILSASNDNFYYNKNNITTSDYMSNENPIGRNINFGKRTLALGGICNGLASLGFKIFVNVPLFDSNILKPFIKFSARANLPIIYQFTNDTFLNTYEAMGINAYEELNSLRLIPNLVNFRPADINEIIGVYSILSNYNKPFTMTIGSGKMKKLPGTNPKYVVAGAYRVKREKGEATGTIIATGTEVSVALKLADELLVYGIDLRVVTMPSTELFELQKDRYKFSLIPKELKTFVIEFGETTLWNKYATSEEYILGITKNSESGTKEELLNYHNLDMDSIKTKIIELMKNN